MRAGSASPFALALLLIASALGCAGHALTPPAATEDASEPTTTDAGVDVPDAGASAAPQTTCCRLTNERGELVSQNCGTALNVPYYEGRGFRCIVP